MPENWNRDFMALLKKVGSISNGEIVVQQEKMGDDLSTIYIMLKPRDGPYKNGHFEFLMYDPSDYPFGCPNVHSETKIFHPNIEDGSVCFSMFDDWTSDMDLIDLAMGLLFLLKNPEITDPLNSEFDGSEDYDDFLNDTRKSLKGQNPDYPKNWHPLEGDDSDDEGSDTEKDRTETPDTPQTDLTLSEKVTTLDNIPTTTTVVRTDENNKPILFATFVVGAVIVSSIIIYKMVNNK